MHLWFEAQVPEYFSEDLFSVMGAQRPDWRWLVVGPEKSGSSFHKVLYGENLTRAHAGHMQTFTSASHVDSSRRQSPADHWQYMLQDPNSTSAWNAVISGSKKWVLWPPHSPPPGDACTQCARCSKIPPGLYQTHGSAQSLVNACIRRHAQRRRVPIG